MTEARTRARAQLALDELRLVGRCEGAGWGDCVDPVRFTPDPYASEINGDDTPTWLCVEHYDQRAGDV